MKHFLLCVAAGLVLAGCSKEAAVCTSTQLEGTWTGGGRTYEFTSCQFTLVDGACATNGTHYIVGQTITFNYVNVDVADCDPLITIAGDTYSFERSGSSLTLNGTSYTLQ